VDGKIFLTGGTGSLGTALLRRAESERWDCEFTIFSRDEMKQAETRSQFPRHRYVLGDVRDQDWLRLMMRGHETVVHAGAYKRIPEAEAHPAEAIYTNVIGSLNVAVAAVEAGVNRVVGISTDKAVGAYNCYGHTKGLMEKLFQTANRWGQTRFTLVRYGNVLGSRGSVVPFFRRQAAESGVITLTDPNMSRFWLTLDDAVNLVVMGLEQPPGTILVPRASASSLAVLAEAVAPGARVRVIGIRPGEKMHEQLIHSGESMHTHEAGAYFRVWPASNATMMITSLPVGFEYTSDKAPQLTVEQLRAMLGEEVGSHV
jgi:UDP-N-acetylglucosamine 4,6-dehydratase/5-epimerase